MSDLIFNQATCFACGTPTANGCECGGVSNAKHPSKMSNEELHRSALEHQIEYQKRMANGGNTDDDDDEDDLEENSLNAPADGHGGMSSVQNFFGVELVNNAAFDRLGDNLVRNAAPEDSLLPPRLIDEVGNEPDSCGRMIVRNENRQIANDRRRQQRLRAAGQGLPIRNDNHSFDGGPVQTSGIDSTSSGSEPQYRDAPPVISGRDMLARIFEGDDIQRENRKRQGLLEDAEGMLELPRTMDQICTERRAEIAGGTAAGRDLVGRWPSLHDR